jgi:integrase
LHSDWINVNPTLGLSRIRVRDEPTGYFNREEFAAVRMSAANYYQRPNLPCAELNTRLLAFVDCLRWSGLRIGDGIKLDGSRLDTKNRIQLYQQKSGVHVFLPIPASVADAKRMLPGERYFFWDGHNYPGAMRNYQYALKTLFKRAGKPRGHAHMLRDTFAVEMLLAGVPLEQVSKLLGHSSVKTTEKHYAPWVKARQQQLEDSVRKA